VAGDEVTACGGQANQIFSLLRSGHGRDVPTTPGVPGDRRHRAHTLGRALATLLASVAVAATVAAGPGAAAPLAAGAPGGALLSPATTAPATARRTTAAPGTSTTSTTSTTPTTSPASGDGRPGPGTSPTSSRPPTPSSSPSSTTSTTAGKTTTAVAASTSSTTGPARSTTTRPQASRSPEPVAELPVVGSVELDTIDASLLGRAQARVSRAQEALDLARSTQAAAHIDAARKAALAARASSLVGQLGGDQRKAAIAVQAAHDRLVAVAVASYTSGGPGSSVDALLSARTIGDFARRQTIFTTVAQTSSAALKAYEHARHDASRSTLRSVDALQGANVAKAVAEERVPVSDDAVARASLALADRRKVLTLVSDAVPTVGTDIPGMVLDAYRRAALAVEAHGCSLGWWGLAGIGKVESNHGRANRAQLTPAGELVPYIVGIALDGSNGTQAVAATDGGRFDGDPVFDHAVGPMQFITSTWVSWDAAGEGGTTPTPTTSMTPRWGRPPICAPPRPSSPPRGGCARPTSRTTTRTATPLRSSPTLSPTATLMPR